MKRKFKLSFSSLIVLLLLQLLLQMNSNTVYASSATISNDYLEFVVADNGRFTIGTTGGDLGNPNDNYKTMLYGHPMPGTSFTTIKVDGSDHVYLADSSTANTDLATLSHTSTYTIGNVLVKQKISIVKNSSTQKEDTVEVKYIVTNNDSIQHEVGTRIMMDTMLGNNDAAPFRVPGIGAVTTERELTGSDIPQYWQAFDDLLNPTVIAQGTLLNCENKPDKVQFTNWGRIYGTTWDYTVNPTSSNGDSAVSIYWNPKYLAAGETREYTTYYGISQFQQDLKPPLALSVTGANNLEVVNGAYNPNPFAVTAYITNIGSSSGTDVKATINLPAGLNLVSGESATVTLGTLEPNQDVQASWNVQVDPAQADRHLTYSIVLESSNSDTKTISRDIYIPSIDSGINSLSINPSTITLSSRQTQQLIVTGTKSSGSTIDLTQSTTGTTYSSSNTNLVTVNENGLISVPTWATSGTAYVRAYNNGKIAATIVTVGTSIGDSFNNLIMTPGTVTLVPGDTCQINTTTMLSDGSTNDVTTQTSYSSSNSNLATIDANGLVTIPSTATSGTVYIRGAYNGKGAAVTVTVSSNNKTVNSLSMNPSTVELVPGGTCQINTIANFTDGTTEDVTTGTSYSSSNTNLATVDANGLIAIPSTATSGTVYIRGTYEGKGTAVTVTVSNQNKIVNSLTMTPSTVALVPGNTCQVNTIANYTDGTTGDVTTGTSYSSSNTNLATVDANGVVTIPSTATSGTVYIRGNYEGKGAATTVTITAPTISSFAFNPSTAVLRPGNTLQVNATAVMSDGTSTDVTGSTVWSTSNANLATVDANGIVTIPSNATNGTVYIRGTYNGKGAATTVTVSAPTFSSLTFTPSTATARPGNTLQVNSKAVMSDGASTDVTGSTVWSTSNANLATVDANGFVTIPSTATNGTVYIRGTYNGKGAATTITVSVPTFSSLTFTPSTATARPGDTLQVNSKAVMSDGTSTDVTGSTVWSTSNANLATVDTNGFVTIPSTAINGTVYIRGTYNGKGAATTITVSTPTFSSLTFNPTTATLGRGNTLQVNASAVMSDGTLQDVTSNTAWTTSNPNLATVDANGFVTIPSTATNGTVYIRGTYNGKGAATTITVSAPAFSSLTFNPSTTTLRRGNTLQVNASAVMSDGSSQDVTSSTIWSTSNANLATVNANGFVTIPITATSGTVYIRGTYNGKGAATTITVQVP